MIKLAALAFVPVLAATFYAHEETQPSANSKRVSVEAQDRKFLADLSTQENPADRAFLANLQAEDQRSAALAAIPVRRAIPVERNVTSPTPVESPAEVQEAPEVRRAIVVAAPAPKAAPTDLRKSLQQSFVTLIEPETAEAAPQRASILIYGDRMIVRTKTALRHETGELQ